MIDCQDDLWKLIVQNDTNARTMCYKEWPLFDDWQLIFGKDRATGESAEDVMEAVNDLLKEDNIAQGGGDGDYHVNLDGILADGNEEENSVCQDEQGNATQRSKGKNGKQLKALKGFTICSGSFVVTPSPDLTSLRVESVTRLIWGKQRTTCWIYLAIYPGCL